MTLLHNLPDSAHQEHHLLRIQSSKSLRLAGQHDEALNQLNNYLHEKQQSYEATPKQTISFELVDILIERSKVKAALGSLENAVFDLDYALTLGGKYHIILMERAELYIRFDRLDFAESDIQTILSSSPNHRKAEQLLERINTRRGTQPTP